jgi:hypothetical protein
MLVQYAEGEDAIALLKLRKGHLCDTLAVGAEARYRQGAAVARASAACFYVRIPRAVLVEEGAHLRGIAVAHASVLSSASFALIVAVFYAARRRTSFIHFG